MQTILCAPNILQGFLTHLANKVPNYAAESETEILIF